MEETNSNEELETKIEDQIQDELNEKETDAEEPSVEEKLTAEVAELKDKYLRLFAEFDNYKKRTARERLDLMSSAAKNTILEILPALDDFDRAVQADSDKKSEETISDGVKMTISRLHKALEQLGLKKMDSNAEPFDPELHEALTEIPAPNDGLKGKVVDTIEKGYFLKEKLIRHAKVVVGK